jgi:hypothetical protein
MMQSLIKSARNTQVGACATLVDDSDHLVKRKLKTIRIMEEEGMHPAPAPYYQGVLFCTAHLQTKWSVKLVRWRKSVAMSSEHGSEKRIERTRWNGNCVAFSQQTRSCKYLSLLCFSRELLWRRGDKGCASFAYERTD